jgi:UDP-hydrolysing UDP-N-acetyl-D-glucosamine 2-epimerase
VKRRIAVVTTSRADYSHLYWVLNDLRDHPDLELSLIVTAAHLSEEFGHAADEILADGHAIDARVECLVDADTDVAMAKTIGIATLGLADVLGSLRPDLLLLIADRYEMLAPASVALALRIPVAHIEGGEVSEGAIDDAVRNALTKMSHLHFTPTAEAERRVLAMGEERFRVHCTGAPSLDHLLRSEPLDRSVLEAKLGIEVEPGATLVAYHPVTLARDTLREVDELFAALEQLPGQVLFCFPNADAGGRELGRRALDFCEGRPRSRVFVNLGPVVYWSLLRAVGTMLGNSSSGIMETPSLALPTVNVGMRQQGRVRAQNIIDAAPCRDAIASALRRASDDRFRETLVGIRNPYGDGHAAGKIVRVLAETPLGEELLVKRAVPVAAADDASLQRRETR